MVGAEAAFLTEVRTPEKEMERLKRVQDEFVRRCKVFMRWVPQSPSLGQRVSKRTNPYYKLAREVGRELARAGFTTLTGGGPGIMEAANRGAFEEGGKSYGLNIILPHEQAPNPYVQKTVDFNYFFTRKVMLIKYSCAFIVMPGGLGTLDELFEAATLINARRLDHFLWSLWAQSFGRACKPRAAT
jgi:uncharacterized protein (TIGR00730 family)